MLQIGQDMKVKCFFTLPLRVLAWFPDPFQVLDRTRSFQASCPVLPQHPELGHPRCQRCQLEGLGLLDLQVEVSQEWSF